MQCFASKTVRSQKHRHSLAGSMFRECMQRRLISLQGSVSKLEYRPMRLNAAISDKNTEFSVASEWPHRQSFSLSFRLFSFD